MIPKARQKGAFRHLEAWQRHWAVRKTHKFRTTEKEVTLVDIIGRRRTVKPNGGYVTLELGGEPVMAYGLDLSREFAEAKKRHPEMQEASFDDNVDYEQEEKTGNEQ